MTRIAIACILFAAYFFAVAGEVPAKIYRYIDRNGVIHFGNTPTMHTEPIKLPPLSESNFQKHFPSYRPPAKTDRKKAKKVKKKKVVEAPKVISGNPISIDLSAKSLPIGYMGDDFEKVYEQIKRECPPKDEFETTPQYIERVNPARFTNNIYAFTVPNGRLCLGSYDADTKIFKFSVRIDNLRGDTGFRTSHDGIVLKTVVGEKKRSHEQTMFGLASDVVTLTGRRYALEITNSSKIIHSLGSKEINLNNVIVKGLDPETARRLKTTSELLIICKPKAKEGSTSILGGTLYYKDASLDSPTREFYYVDSLLVEIYELWGYSPETGEVFFKVKLP